jgi:hypothetical protein
MVAMPGGSSAPGPVACGGTGVEEGCGTGAAPASTGGGAPYMATGAESTGATELGLGLTGGELAGAFGGSTGEHATADATAATAAT